MSRWVPPRRTWTVTVAPCRCGGTSSGSPGRRPAPAGDHPGHAQHGGERGREPGQRLGGGRDGDGGSLSAVSLSRVSPRVVHHRSMRPAPPQPWCHQAASARTDLQQPGWPSRPRPYVPPTGRTWPHDHAVVPGQAANEADTLPVSGVTTAAIRLKPQCLKCVWTLLGLPLLCAESTQWRGLACSSAWPDRYNVRRLHGSLGHVPPVEYERPLRPQPRAATRIGPAENLGRFTPAGQHALRFGR